MNKRNRINTIGGMADSPDFLRGREIFSENCLPRELKEELELDLYDTCTISNFNAAFLKIPNSDEMRESLFPVEYYMK